MALCRRTVGGDWEDLGMSRTCDVCGHEVPTQGGEGRFSVHDRSGNAEALFGPRRIPAAERCSGSLLHPVDNQNGGSIHTTPGGLPGLGKRR
jgi:hypothetical protein